MAAAAFVLVASLAEAGEYFEKDGLALQGYEPVSYFTESKPRPGIAAHSYTHKGSTFRFVSAENRRLFVENPEKYAPQFGGYCAFGAARGHKSSTDPSAFAIVDGKLYLNHNALVRRLWHRSRVGSQPMKN